MSLSLIHIYGGYGRLSTIIESAEATDDYTVELRLTQPYYNTLRELCLANPFGIVSSEPVSYTHLTETESLCCLQTGTV